jgi:hypothetical protein
VKARHGALFALLFGFAVICGSAYAAAAAFTEVGTFAENPSGVGGAGGGAGQLSNPGQAAVDVSSEKLYVADTDNGRVEVFRPTETGAVFDSERSAPGATGIAIDQGSGDVYVAESTGIEKLDSSLQPVAGWTDPGVTGALAVDPASGDLLVADQGADLVRRYEADGTAAGSFAAARPISIAANSAGEVFVVTSTGNVSLECGATSAVRRYSSAGIEVGVVGSGLEAPGAVAVDPADDAIVVGARVNQYNCGAARPLAVFFDAAGSEVERHELAGNTLYATVPGIAYATFSNQAARAYVVTKSPAGDAFGNTKVTVFEVPPPPAPPTITGSVAFPTSTEASLTAMLNPGHDLTRYHFEYGTSTAYGTSTPERTVPASGKDAQVRQALTGLAPGSTYHFRLVATNSTGTVRGGDAVFVTTQARSSADSCPNASIRAAQGSAYLPDCRAYEMVSPVDKSGGIIAFPSGSQGHSSTRGAVTGISPDGGLAAFWSYQAFGDARSGAVQSYRARRTADGWTTTAWSPALPSTEVTPKLDDWAFVAFATEDFSKGYIRTPFPFDPLDQRPRDPSKDDQNFDIYGIEPDGRVSWETRPDGSGPDTVAAAAQLVGASDDGSATLFETAEPMTPNAADQVGGQSLYLRAGGRTVLVAAEGEGPAISSCGATLRDPSLRGIAKPNAVSPDASRIFFTAPDPAASSGDPSCAEPPQVYVRDHGTVVMASASQRAVPDAPARARFEDATADGSSVIFRSDAALTEDADPANDGFLYRYDVGSGDLTLLTPAGGVTRMVALSDDGSHLYYLAGSTLYADVDGAVAEITPLTADQSGIEEARYWIDAPAPIRVTPDGRFIAFSTLMNLGAFQHPGVAEIYRYDALTRDLVCASCNLSGAAPLGNAGFSSNSESGAAVAVYRDPRNMSADGRRIAFDTIDSLDPLDQNGVADVYEWVDGAVHLISDGTSKDGSFLFDVDADRGNILFATTSSLVARDTDRGAQDIYDARIDGGFAEGAPPAPGCGGEGCQGEAGTPPAWNPPATGLTSGPGNLDRRKHGKPRCPKGKHAVRSHGKSRCVKNRNQSKSQGKGKRGKTAGKHRGAQRRVGLERGAAR